MRKPKESVVSTMMGLQTWMCRTQHSGWVVPLQSSGGFAMQGELLRSAVPKANELLLLMMPPFPRL